MLVILLVCHFIQPAHAAFKSGSRCTSLNKIIKIGGKELKCVKKGNKLILKDVTKKVTEIQMTPKETFLPAENCKLLDYTLPNNYSAISHAFPNPSALHNNFNIRTLALFVDYPDLIGGYDPSKEKQSSIDEINDFYNQVSYGKLKFSWTITNSFSRMPHEVGYYHLTRSTFNTTGSPDNTNFLQDAVNASDDIVDFTMYDLVIVYGPKTATTNQIGEYPGTRSGTQARIMSREGQVRNIQTSIAKGFRYGSTKLGMYYSAGLIHEIGHELGLVDLYLYPNNEPHLYGSTNVYSGIGKSTEIFGYMGTFDFMNNLGGQAPEPIGWNRWLLNFIGENQVVCADEGHLGVLKLEPIELKTAGTKLAIVRISDSEAIAIESRRAAGYDESLSAEGVLVYRINTRWTTGHGPIAVVSEPSRAASEYDLLGKDETVTIFGIKISTIHSSAQGDIVKLEKISVS